MIQHKPSPSKNKPFESLNLQYDHYAVILLSDWEQWQFCDFDQLEGSYSGMGTREVSYVKLYRHRANSSLLYCRAARKEAYRTSFNELNDYYTLKSKSQN